MMVIYVVILWIGLLSLLDVSQLGFLLYFWATNNVNLQEQVWFTLPRNVPQNIH